MVYACFHVDRDHYSHTRTLIALTVWPNGNSSTSFSPLSTSQPLSDKWLCWRPQKMYRSAHKTLKDRHNCSGRADAVVLCDTSPKYKYKTSRIFYWVLQGSSPMARRENIILSVLNDSVHTSKCVWVIKNNGYNAQSSVVFHFFCSRAQYCEETLTSPSTILFCSSSEQSQ